MNDKIKTSNHNVSLLAALGFKRHKNTTIFIKGNDYILSPSVSESNGKYWFDVREVNLKVVNNDKTLLIVRIVPDLFIIEPLKNLSSLLNQSVMDNRPKSGNVWSIHFSMIKDSKNVFLFNIKNESDKVLTALINKEQFIDCYAAYVGMRYEPNLQNHAETRKSEPLAGSDA